MLLKVLNDWVEACDFGKEVVIIYVTNRKLLDNVILLLYALALWFPPKDFCPIVGECAEESEQYTTLEEESLFWGRDSWS